MITQQHVESLIDRWSGDPNEIVATSYAETVGAPTLFPAGCFDALLALRGDQGGRAILDDPLFAVREIAFEDAAVDVDTVEDLARISRNAHS